MIEAAPSTAAAATGLVTPSFSPKREQPVPSLALTGGEGVGDEDDEADHLFGPPPAFPSGGGGHSSSRAGKRRRTYVSVSTSSAGEGKGDAVDDGAPPSPAVRRLVGGGRGVDKKEGGDSAETFTASQTEDHLRREFNHRRSTGDAAMLLASVSDLARREVRGRAAGGDDYDDEDEMTLEAQRQSAKKQCMAPILGEANGAGANGAGANGAGTNGVGARQVRAKRRKQGSAQAPPQRCHPLSFALSGTASEPSESCSTATTPRKSNVHGSVSGPSDSTSGSAARSPSFSLAVRPKPQAHRLSYIFTNEEALARAERTRVGGSTPSSGLHPRRTNNPQVTPDSRGTPSPPPMGGHRGLTPPRGKPERHHPPPTSREEHPAEGHVPRPREALPAPPGGWHHHHPNPHSHGHPPPSPGHRPDKFNLPPQQQQQRPHVPPRHGTQYPPYAPYPPLLPSADGAPPSYLHPHPVHSGHNPHPPPHLEAAPAGHNAWQRPPHVSSLDEAHRHGGHAHPRDHRTPERRAEGYATHRAPPHPPAPPREGYWYDRERDSRSPGQPAVRPLSHLVPSEEEDHRDIRAARSRDEGYPPPLAGPSPHRQQQLAGWYGYPPHGHPSHDPHHHRPGAVEAGGPPPRPPATPYHEYGAAPPLPEEAGGAWGEGGDETGRYRHSSAHQPHHPPPHPQSGQQHPYSDPRAADPRYTGSGPPIKERDFPERRAFRRVAGADERPPPYPSSETPARTVAPASHYGGGGPPPPVYPALETPPRGAPGSLLHPAFETPPQGVGREEYYRSGGEGGGAFPPQSHYRDGGDAYHPSAHRGDEATFSTPPTSGAGGGRSDPPAPHGGEYPPLQHHAPPRYPDEDDGVGGWDRTPDNLGPAVSHESENGAGGGPRGGQFSRGERNVYSEPILLRKKFSWRNYPELESFLINNRTDYLRHSALNYTAEQKHFNNRLTEGLLELAAKHNYVFDEAVFNFVAVRDRIRCYYKSYVQSSKKRGVIVGFPKVNHRTGMVEESAPTDDVALEEDGIRGATTEVSM